MEKKLKFFIPMLIGVLFVVTTVKASTMVMGNNIITSGNITTTGSIGIGTTDPQAKLHIYSPTEAVIRVSDGGSTHSILGATSTSGYVGTYNNNSFSIRTNDQDQIFIKDNNNGSNVKIGIGTTTPASKLHLFDDQNNVQLTIEGINPMLRLSDTNSSINNKNWALYANNDILRGAAAEDGWANGDNSWLEVRRNGIQGISSVSFPDGNVGIGTTTPTQKLVVSGNILANGTVIGPDNDNGAVSVTHGLKLINAGNPYILFDNPGAGLSKWYVSGQDDRFSIFLSGDINKGVHLLNSGNVGIGTSTPDALFQVYKNNATTTVEFGGVDSAQKGSCLKLRDSDGNGWTYCTVLDGSLACSQTSCE